MRILVISSCTGEKSITHERALTLEDFRKGTDHVNRREKELTELTIPAVELYTGQQHVRLLRGIRFLQEKLLTDSANTLDLWILSAGYGFVPGDRKLAPYEATFKGMGKKIRQEWGRNLDVPKNFLRMLSAPYDLALVLLGDDYLSVCEIDDNLTLGGPTLLLCGSRGAARLPRIPNLRLLPLTNQDAKRFSCGLVALKGELGARLLTAIGSKPSMLSKISDPSVDLRSLLDHPPESGKVVLHKKAIPNPQVDRVIELLKNWWRKPHKKKLRYFIPEWDDLVDPDYSFETDTHSGGVGDWENEVYSHQLYPEPNYDGILISKVVAEKSKKKKARINAMGVHRFLRVPREFPVMGDCGAFGYIMQETPPYTTAEILDYYTRLGFDFGVSIDHLIVKATDAQRTFRYDLTIHNAEEFLREHQKRGLTWVPIGAVQGWDAKSYAEAAKQCAKMGYKYIGLGGLVRTSTFEILRVLDEVYKAIPQGVKIHLFGLARIAALRKFEKFGVCSVDSASFLRRAWMGTGQNYLAEDGQLYTAIRIPEANKSFRAKRMVEEGRVDSQKVKELEKDCMMAMRDFDKGRLSIESTLDVIDEYDHLITPNRGDTRSLFRFTLEASPWKQCPCDICRKDGVEVIIFRGNNRNRRRGFHNTYSFYRIFQRVLAGETISLQRGKKYKEGSQFRLFSRV